MFGLEKKNRLSRIDREKTEGIAYATAKAMHEVVDKYNLPHGEALKTFGLAYAHALAEHAGEDAEELFGEEMDELVEKMDKKYDD